MIDIFVSNLTKHRNGEDVGEWVYLPETEEHLNEILDEILGEKRSDELFIPDFTSDIRNLEIDEYTDIIALNKFAQYIEDELNEEEIYKLEALLYIGEDYKKLTKNKDRLEDCYVYYDCHDMRDVACDSSDWIFDSITDKKIREIVETFFDYESYGDSLEINGTFVNLGNGIYVEIM